jgi:Ca-activated chloride channel family protein
VEAIMSLADLTTIFDQLRFLRPDWFYGFLPLIVFIVLMRKRRTASRSWKTVCDARLLPHVLMQGGGGNTSRLPLLLIAIATSLSLVALAGPVWKKLPQPVFREASALVIALDLSQSMNATDIKPTRLERAKLKLLDMLDAHSNGQTALIVYAATAFTVTPLTDDTNTIRNLVPTLTTDLMPAQGSNAAAALKQASDLLRQAGIANGDVLLVTDGLGPSDRAAIEKTHAEGHRVSILGVGTAEGSPIPLSGGFLKDASGAIVIPRLHTKDLQQAALRGGGLYVGMRVDDADINRLEKLFDSARNSHRTKDTDLSADTWREEGPWLLLPVLLLVMLWPRRGWLLLLTICVLPLPQPAYASDFGLDLDHLWRSPDQQGMHAFEAGDAKQAAEHFNDPQWKAAAAYRAGDYAKANELLKQATSSEDNYNRGNALARMGNYPEAVAAYKKALEMDANNKDARYNLDLVKKQMQQQKQNSQSDKSKQDDQQSQDQQSQDQQQQSGESSDQKNKQKQDSNQKSADQQNSEQKNSDQQNKGEESQASDQANDQAGKQSENPAEQNPQGKDKSTEEDKQQNGQQPSNPEQDKFGDESKKDEQQRFAEQMKNEQQQKAEDDNDNKEEQQPDDAQVSEQQEPANESMAEARDSDNAPMTEDEHASEQLLRRIPDDPGGLMRRKFIYQYRQMPNQTDSEQPW